MSVKTTRAARVPEKAPPPAATTGGPSDLEQNVARKLLIGGGDLSSLTIEERQWYYNAMCERVGLDPMSQPFKLLLLDGKLVLYCDRSGSAQLVQKHKVSHVITAREILVDKAGECYVVTAKASTPDGRSEESIGAVPLYKEDGTWENVERRNRNGETYTKRAFKGNGTHRPLLGEERCNALMKAETKAKRRSSLDLLGLGILDESETHSIAGAETVPLDYVQAQRDAESRARAEAPPKSEKELAEAGRQYAAELTGSRPAPKAPEKAPRRPESEPEPEPEPTEPPAEPEPESELEEAQAEAPPKLPPGVEDVKTQALLIAELEKRADAEGIEYAWLDRLCAKNGWITEDQCTGEVPTRILRAMLLEKNWNKVVAKWRATNPKRK